MRRNTRRRSSARLAFLLALLACIGLSRTQAADVTAASAGLSPAQEPITPIPQPPPADPRKLMLGALLFADPRLSHNDRMACSSCHDVSTNGADDGGQQAACNSGAAQPLDTPTVFNAALSYRLNWTGNVRTLEEQALSSIQSPLSLAASIDEVLRKLRADPATVRRFEEAYGHGPDKAALLDAIAVYERSLVTPGSRFDRWLEGDRTALTELEQSGYESFKSLGCISCHQGVNVGGNLLQRHGIFRPLASRLPEILRVPSLRNVATTAPYFHDGSASTLNQAVREMASAQLDVTLSDQQIDAIVAFLKTLTGTLGGVPVSAP
ncbi:MAG TPA: cytochrome c peroxidase [Acetobacteraceae bacterium]|nr:cytochrome c peroxidase [Acetobacteraceae bacterium]